MGFQETVDWYNANAKTYAKKSLAIDDSELLDIFAKKVGPSARVLDAGCAAGKHTKMLAESGLQAEGIDITESFIDIARETYPDIPFRLGSFLDLPFGSGTFDGVWAHASLLHLETVEDVQKALSEFSRILKTGGLIHVFLKKQQGEEKTSVVTDTLSEHDRFFQWFTKQEVEELLQTSGFSVASIVDDYPDPAGRDELQWIWALAVKK